MITETEAMRLAREHLVASAELDLVTGPPGAMYLVDRGELRVGADEIVAVRKLDGTVAYHGKVDE